MNEFRLLKDVYGYPLEVRVSDISMIEPYITYTSDYKYSKAKITLHCGKEVEVQECLADIRSLLGIER